MKKIYEAPNATLTGFEAAENLANVIDFDDLISLKGGSGTAVEPSGGDINLDTNQ